MKEFLNFVFSDLKRAVGVLFGTVVPLIGLVSFFIDPWFIGGDGVHNTIVIIALILLPTTIFMSWCRVYKLYKKAKKYPWTK